MDSNDAEIINRCIKDLGDEDISTQTWVGQILLEKSELAVGPLITNIKKEMYSISPESGRRRRGVVRVLGLIGDVRAVEPLIQAMGNKYCEISWIVSALGLIRDVRAVEPLIQAMGNEDKYVRQCAAEALGQIGDERAFDSLIKALGDENEDVRASAAKALGQIGDKRAFDSLIKALGDEKSSVRGRAASALGDIGDKRVVEPLTRSIENENNAYVIENIKDALREIGGSSVIPSGYFECPRPDGDGLCSFDYGPCPPPGTKIPRGTGYLWISKEAVDFRRDARSVEETERKIQRIQSDYEAKRTILTIDPSVVKPILMCEECAKSLGLDLDVAAADAKHWWETGLAPLRPTPMKIKNNHG